MPKGTKVHKAYRAMLAKRYSKAKAAKIAQSKTGQSLKTGRPPRKSKRKGRRKKRSRK